MIVHHLRDFGFWEYEEANIPVFHTTKKDIHIKAVTPTPLGIAMFDACRRRPYELYNEHRDEKQISEIGAMKSLMPIIERLGLTRPSSQQKIESFEQPLERIFPSVDAKLIDAILDHGKEKPTPGRGGNVYIFKVLYGRNIWRRIKISSANSLHHLHEAIQEAFEFDNDHSYAFFMDGSRGHKTPIGKGTLAIVHLLTGQPSVSWDW